MPTINITIRDKIAQAEGSPEIICGNSGYTAVFDFDSEWSAYTAKTARFRFYRNGIMQRYDVLFTGSTVEIPVLNDIYEVEIGVYAGNIETSTGARIPCARSITDGDAVHDPPSPDVYNQLMEYLAGIQSGGAQVGNAVPALYGTAMSRIGTPEYPLLQGEIPVVQGGWSGSDGSTITTYFDEDVNPTYYPIRCCAPRIYCIPAGKSATISVSESGIQVYYKIVSEWQVQVSQSTWIDSPTVIDNGASQSDVYCVLIFHDTEDVAITPSDVGTVTAVLE